MNAQRLAQGFASRNPELLWPTGLNDAKLTQAFPISTPQTSSILVQLTRQAAT
jgi:hypothetical protein